MSIAVRFPPPMREAGSSLPPGVDGLIRGDLQLGLQKFVLEENNSSAFSDVCSYQITARWWGELGTGEILKVNCYFPWDFKLWRTVIRGLVL